MSHLRMTLFSGTQYCESPEKRYLCTFPGRKIWQYILTKIIKSAFPLAQQFYFQNFSFQKKIIGYEDVCSEMFFATLFVMAKTKQKNKTHKEITKISQASLRFQCNYQVACFRHLSAGGENMAYFNCKGSVASNTHRMILLKILY